MSKHYPNAPVLTKIAGGVPCAITLKKISAPGIMLVGDAARQVNPLSGGGIASGMIGGKIAGMIAADAIKMNKLDHILTYDKAWADRLGKRHETFNRIKEGIVVSDPRGQIFRAQVECEGIRQADPGALSVCLCIGTPWAG